MRVKRYLGETMQDAIFKVKADLGAEAIILHTRKVKEGSFLGLFGKKMIEVVATVEEDREKEITREMRQELHILKDKIVKLEQDKREEQPPRAGAYYPQVAVSMNQLIFPGKVQKFADSLTNNGVFPEVVTEICQRAMVRLEVHQFHKEEEIYPVLVEEIASMIPSAKPIDLFRSRKVLAFVGATGVGKTTTIAKLAALVALEGKKKVALITADTYRIAAVEQLKIYSDIINVPLRVIYSNEDLEKALNDLKACDLIFIDTAGRSQRNQSQMEQLKEFLSKELIDEVHLVISLNSSIDNITETIENFNQMYISSLILTKLDETRKVGIILNILANTDHEISYITFGQNVPEDLEKADSRKLAEMILKEQ
ncbi:MAG: flagellar biosynthesis protein FlhF [Halanaerobiales bacterium]|nr:flagellar biosynthesis protein FlhF [Halanaerobiales bacterium]